MSHLNDDEMEELGGSYTHHVTPLGGGLDEGSVFDVLAAYAREPFGFDDSVPFSVVAFYNANEETVYLQFVPVNILKRTMYFAVNKTSMASSSEDFHPKDIVLVFVSMLRRGPGEFMAFSVDAIASRFKDIYIPDYGNSARGLFEDDEPFEL